VGEDGTGRKGEKLLFSEWVRYVVQCVLEKKKKKKRPAASSVNKLKKAEENNKLKSLSEKVMWGKVRLKIGQGKKELTVM